MRADIGFGWIVFVGFLLWVLQALRAGGRGERSAGAPGPRSYRPDATQREGEQLEELLRQLQGRLGRPEAPGNTKVLVKRPAPARPPEAISLETRIDREAEAEAFERRRTEARPTTESAEGVRIGPVSRLTPHQLRDAIVWNEILGPPMALRD